MGEDEVTLTSWLHAQAERTKKTEERRGGYMATSDVGSDKGPEPGDDAQSRGRPARGRGWALRFADNLSVQSSGVRKSDPDNCEK